MMLNSGFRRFFFCPGLPSADHTVAINKAVQLIWRFTSPVQVPGKWFLRSIVLLSYIIKPTTFIAIEGRSRRRGKKMLIIVFIVFHQCFGTKCFAVKLA